MTEGTTFRTATEADLAAIAGLLHDDILGSGREEPDDIERYHRAFAEIDADSSEHLIVADRDGQVVGTMQLSVLPGMSRHASRRLQIEGVRVSSGLRGQGLGAAMIRWALRRAGELGCDLVQLTSDRRREEAQQFYERLGFVPSHIGYKQDLPGQVDR